ncbi:putative mitochondrial ribosomal protein l12 strongylocentrotus purpuratus [Paragonimus heterotremus]|uniref:Putative mitochondrial ribosomal protein l12 strongylocentrotus purpuratus n=1 Tax=Paragonimus heterotremus TaxID=100268 RepID=A0A8J4SYF9_9TREM|nr:putative mitochondrial ribosomal protein l12 strongylocentrotus purpuratus [Paragonimus heterotremus]
MSFMRLHITSCLITRVASKSQFLTNKLHTCSQATFPEQLKTNISLEPPEIPGSATEKSYPAHIIKLANEVCQLTLMEVADLSELLQKKLNIKTAVMPMMGGVPVGSVEPATTTAEDQQQQPTKSSFTVKLVKFDAARKVPLIKEIKLLVPEMNLVQAKKFVEVSTPCFILLNTSCGLGNNLLTSNITLFISDCCH